MGFSRQESSRGLPFPPPVVQPRSPTLQVDSLHLSLHNPRSELRLKRKRGWFRASPRAKVRTQGSSPNVDVSCRLNHVSVPQKCCVCISELWVSPRAAHRGGWLPPGLGREELTMCAQFWKASASGTWQEKNQLLHGGRTGHPSQTRRLIALQPEPGRESGDKRG